MPGSIAENSNSDSSSSSNHWWSKDFLGIRVFLAILFAFVLAIFIHFREVKIDVLELGSASKQYIIAQVDFEYPNEEATLVLKQQAIQDIGVIYRFDPKQLRAVLSEFEDQLIKDKSWRVSFPEATFEMMYEGTESLEEYLLEVRFTDPRTIEKIRNLKSSTDHFFEVPFSERKLSLLPVNFWSEVQESVFPPKQTNAQVASYIMSFFMLQNWNLSSDSFLEKKLKIQVQDAIAEQYTRVAAGSHIIDPGEKVNQRHIYMLQSMKKALGESRNLWNPFSIIGSFLLAAMITLLMVIYLKIYHKDIAGSTRKCLLLVTILITSLILSKATEYLLLNKGFNLVELARYPLIVPFAAVLLCVLLGTRVALFCSIFLTILEGVTLALDHDHFIILNLIASLCTIMFARSLHKRKDIFEVFAKTWLCCIPVLLAFNLADGTLLDINLLSDLICTFAFLAISALLALGILPLLESVFKMLTDMTLMEYMDPNNELLRRLSLEAPGTYQHCLVVGNVAEAGARAIGANDLFCRAATLYHDIGKLFNPHYFTENQLGGFNIHQLLTPLESTHVIMAHVSEGEALAKKYRLPQSFIDVIREHHGTTLVYYFYCKQIEQMEGDTLRVNEKLFRYPGPKPHTKESAIIMIADTLEAASRSLDDISEETLNGMVNKLVSEKAEDGQLDECQLTFEELGIVKKAMVKALLVTRHMRVKYPTRNS
ncbi:MAG: HDIG domain-containing protein [Chlamydiae bacterium]|nr:HDIG domain-containing protein [Chlamydiota bacterium]